MRKYSSYLVLLLSSLVLQAQTFQNGQAARAVFGQTNFTAGNPTSSQNILGGVGGLAYANGILWVADSNRVAATPNNSRVMGFPVNQIPTPHADLTTLGLTNPDCYLCGFPATYILGQNAYTFPSTNTTCPSGTVTSTCYAISLGSTGMANSTGVATDGHYFAVADTDNNRVLLWNEVPTQVDQPADLELGQANFNSNSPIVPPSRTSLLGPQGVWIQNNHLFVADTQNHRVLIWNSWPTQNNQPADLVLGQNDFVHAFAPPVTDPPAPTAANQLLNPASVTADASHLYVSDLGHNRVLIWNEIPTVNAQNADVVVGQPDMTQTTANNPVVCGGYNINPSTAQCQTSLNFPRFALPVNHQLFIADGGNDRVLIYSQIPTTNGVPANGVLGEPDFIQDLGSSASISIASTAVDNNGGVDLLESPQALAWDGANLYVSDPYSRRVLAFTPGDTDLPPNSIVNYASEIIRQEGIVQFTVPTGGTLTAGDTASITINSTAHSYTLTKTDTLDTIAQNLVKIINGTISGDTPDPNVTAIFAGAGTGTVYLSSIATDLPYDSITLAAAPSLSTADANLLATASSSYLSAGTASTGAPGMLVEINGTNLSDNTATAPQNGNDLPNTLGGVQIYMDGYACPLFKVSPTQLVSVIPYPYGDRNSTSVYVRTVHNDGSITVTNAEGVYVAPANPGIFNAPAFAGQARPWPITQATHQSGNAASVVDFEDQPVAGNLAIINVSGVNYQYAVTAADVTTGTLNSTVQGLVNVINAANDPNVTASVGGAFNRVILTARAAEPGGNGIAITATSATSATNSAVPTTLTLTAYSPTTCCQVTPNSPIQIGNPAAPGELINITTAGMGAITDPTNTAGSRLGTGVPFVGVPLNTAVSSVNATLAGSATAEVINADLPTGSYGTYNVQILIPQGQATNNATTLNIAQNAFISNTVTIPIGPAVAYTPAPVVAPVTTLSQLIEAPAAGSTVSGTLVASGWALDSASPLSYVTVSIDGQVQGSATRYPRPDVCAGYTSPDCPSPGPGWYLVIDTTQFPDGVHTIDVTAVNNLNVAATISQTFTIANTGVGADSTFHGLVEVPSANFTYRGTTTFSGWTTDTSSAIASVTIYVDGTREGPATLYSRPDVCAVYPGPNCQAGWYINFNTDTVGNGAHSLIAKALSSDGHTYTTSQTFQVQNFGGGSTSTAANIEAPSVGAAPFTGTLSIGGWAGDFKTTVTSIGVTVDGIVYNNAGYGYARPDVCSGLAFVNCPGAGWAGAIDTTQLADGAHTLGIVVNLAGEQSVTFSRSFQVNNQGTTAEPVLSNIDAPTATSSVSGTFTASGWAISKTAGDPVITVALKVDGSSFGNATYGAARPDVCAAGPVADSCPNVGWYANLNSALLGNGPHTFEVTTTTAAGHRASADTTFTVNNPTSGPGRVAIESPAASSSPFQGVALFSGWALYDNGRVTSLTVTVDGVPYGEANYGNIPRPDVCNAFPARANCPNAGWTFSVDTTKLTDGSHTLQVTENNADGTYASSESTFTVANNATTNPLQIFVDAPSISNNIYGVITISGWALNANSVITAINLSVDGVPIGAATYGTGRPDVCIVFPGTPGCPNLGWYLVFNTQTIPDGTHTLSVTATTTTGQSSTISQTFNVAN